MTPTDIVPLLPWIFLCLSEKDLIKESKKQGFPVLEFLPHGAAACCNTFDYEGKPYIAVTIDFNLCKQMAAEQIYSLLVHEAVHCAQAYWRMIGEKSPSSEFMAYTIQHIAQFLMIEYKRKARLINKKAPKLAG